MLGFVRVARQLYMGKQPCALCSNKYSCCICGLIRYIHHCNNVRWSVSVIGGPILTLMSSITSW